MNLFRGIFLVLAGAWLAQGPATAQVGASTLMGRVADASSAAIPNVQVKVVNEDSGAAVSVQSNHEGIYRAAALIPGVYTMELRAAGFEPLIRKNIVIQVAQTVAVDFTLQVGAQ